MTKKKNELIKSLSQHKNDVGSTEVQIGVLNDKINNLTLHFKKFKKDKNADKKNGALTSISPIKPPITGPSINPKPKAAPITAKFFFLSFASEISAK